MDERDDSLPEARVVVEIRGDRSAISRTLAALCVPDVTVAQLPQDGGDGRRGDPEASSP